MKEKRSNDDASFFSAVALLGQIGLYIALPTLLGAFGGHYLDTVFADSVPIATIIGLLLGLVAGVSLVVRAVSHISE